MKTVIEHLRRHAVAYVALVLAMSGTSAAAAVYLPANSVNTRQLANGAVTGKKVHPHSLLADDFANGQLPQGPRGTTGPQGPAGDTGTAGPTGDTGPAGPKGDTGAAGPKGDTGPAGAQGPKGDTGPAGPQGSRGDTGAVGPQGPKGDTGPAGPQGQAGASGISGYTVITSDGDIGTAAGSTSQFELFARCPPGTRLLGGGATASTDEPILTNSGPYQDSSGRYEIWDARWLVRSDVASGDTIHVRDYAYCASVNS
jgi:hypothetical protein